MIIFSAIKSLDDDSIHLGHRHHNILTNMTNQNYNKPIKGIQGFITEEMVFLNRKDALQHAIECNQIKPEDVEMYNIGLDSSDLWSSINLDKERGLFMGILIKHKE